MTEKHTQGEWKVTTDGQKVTSILDRNDANGFNNVCSINEHVEEREANAKLIASAPEMLTLLTKLIDLKYLSEYSDQDGVTQEAKDLIKQATA